MSAASKAFESLILGQLHRALRDDPNVLLHYDTLMKGLVPYCWPLGGQGRIVEPSALEAYRCVHNLSYPGCFCAAVLNSPQPTETVLVVVDNIVGKEYLFACAKSRCGYLVKAYFRTGHPVLHFSHRDQPLNPMPSRALVPHALDILADVAAQQNLAEKTVWTSGRREDIDALRFISLIHPSITSLNVPTAGSMIYRLHSAHRPGLTFEEFRDTFACCECGIVATRRKHAVHQCKRVAAPTTNWQENVLEVSDAEVQTLLLRLDMNGSDMTLEMLMQILAKCPCGMVMTKQRLHAHECRR